MTASTRLLIVDDNPDDHELIRRLLSRSSQHRYTFYEAEVATAALEIVATTPIDCMLLDYHLPDSDGTEVLAELAQSAGGLTTIPVVVFTGLGDEELAVQALQAGAMDYLVKDRLAGPQLSRAIDEAIRHHSLRAQLQQRQRYLEQHAAALEERVATLQTHLDMERERAELHATLAAEQIRFAKVAATVPGVICTVLLSPDGTLRIPYASPAFERVLGLSPAAVADDIGPLTARLAPQDVAPFAAAMIESARTLQPWYGEYRYHHPSRGAIWVENHSMPIRDADGSTVWHGVMTDITARKQAEQALRELNVELERRVAERTADLQASQDRLTLATHSAGIGIWDWDIVNDTLTWDERMFDLYGVAPGSASVSYATWLASLHPDDRAHAELVARRTLRGEQEYDTEFRVCHPDGSVRVLKAHANIQRGPAGEPLHMIGVNFDITVRKQTEELLRQANRDMAYAARMKDEFLANMSHELRTPLNAILGFSESMLEGVQGPITERQQSALRHIDASGRHLLTLINDILDLSKVESGRMDLQIEAVGLSEVCQSSLLFIKEAALKKGLRVAVHIQDPIAIVAVDPQRLKQMLINLLSNAVKFTPSGGTVSLEAGTDRAANLLRFTVADTGIGIAPEDLGRLFQPFSQLDPAFNREHRGTGLGLALVRRLAKLHGGEVTVESARGKGSRFTISLPFRDAPQPLAAAPAAPSAPQRGAAPTVAAGEALGRILLAEDNATNIDTLSDYLRARNYEVFIARDGYEVLAQVDEIRPALILMDIQMPRMDGLEAIRRLRALPAHQRTPIIALTALAMPGDRERCLEAGANEYMSKPVSMRELVEMIRQLLDARPS